MREFKSDRGFQAVIHDGYDTDKSRGEHRLVGQSSAVGDYKDSLDKPGSSFLWMGEHHHLNREEVAKLIGYLQHWLDTGLLFPVEVEDTDDER
jgi:hypothetical protein